MSENDRYTTMDLVALQAEARERGVDVVRRNSAQLRNALREQDRIDAIQVEPAEESATEQAVAKAKPKGKKARKRARKAAEAELKELNAKRQQLQEELEAIDESICELKAKLVKLGSKKVKPPTVWQRAWQRFKAWCATPVAPVAASRRVKSKKKGDK